MDSMHVDSFNLVDTCCTKAELEILNLENGISNRRPEPNFLKQRSERLLANAEKLVMGNHSNNASQKLNQHY